MIKLVRSSRFSLIFLVQYQKMAHFLSFGCCTPLLLVLTLTYLPQPTREFQLGSESNDDGDGNENDENGFSNYRLPSLRANSPGRSGGGGVGGGRGEGELATTSLGILNSTSSSPVALPRLNCQISTNQR